MAKEDIYHYCATDPVYRTEWHWITEDIALGSYPLDPAVREILDAGITAIISLRMDEPAYDRSLFQHSHVMLVEDGAAFPYEALVDGLSFLHETIEAGHKVYIHCFAGISRSSFFVSCYLMLSEGIPFEEAVSRVRAARPQCWPHGALYDASLLERLCAERDLILGADGRKEA